jgi:hypothetical protein
MGAVMSGVIGERGPFGPDGITTVHTGGAGEFYEAKIIQDKPGVGRGMLWLRSHVPVDEIPIGKYTVTPPTPGTETEKSISLCSGPDGGVIDYDKFATGTVVVSDDGVAVIASTPNGDSVTASFSVQR